MDWGADVAVRLTAKHHGRSMERLWSAMRNKPRFFDWYKMWREAVIAVDPPRWSRGRIPMAERIAYRVGEHTKEWVNRMVSW